MGSTRAAEQNTGDNSNLNVKERMAMKKGDNDKVWLNVFDGSNFGIWKAKLCVLLERKEIEDVVFGTQVMPDSASKPEEYKVWKSKDNKGRQIISQSVSDDVFTHLMQCKTSNEMFTCVSTSHEPWKNRNTG